jgi:hypothetical protein
VETENPSACATVNCNWCKGEIVLCYLYVNVIKSECVTQLIINPIIQTRTCLISGIYHHTCHNMFSWEYTDNQCNQFMYVTLLYTSHSFVIMS